MPRASYGDKFTVTIMKGEEKHTVLDLTSKVIDFEVVLGSDNAPKSLLVLAEEELVAIDLTAEAMPAFQAPYLNPIHASAITCMAFVNNVAADVFAKISEAGAHERKDKVSESAFPVCGGVASAAAAKKSHDVLVTGHEDGTVKLWSCEGSTQTLLLTVRTNKFFAGDDLDEPAGTRSRASLFFPSCLTWRFQTTTRRTSGRRSAASVTSIRTATTRAWLSRRSRCAPPPAAF
jgi:lethal(2) giant larvae protein